MNVTLNMLGMFQIRRCPFAAKLAGSVYPGKPAEENNGGDRGVEPLEDGKKTRV